MYNKYRSRREVLRFGLASGAGLVGHLSLGDERRDDKVESSISRHFPILSQTVNGKRLIYFDNAATAQRPREVIDAVTGFYSRDNANPASNLHSLAKRSFEAYEGARNSIAGFIKANDSSEVIFTRGTTEGINLVASTWGETNIGSGDEIVLTVAEHASNMLPWQLLARRRGARVRYADVLDDGNLDLGSLKVQITQRTKLVCFSHVSNVLGIINPASEICRLAHENGAKVLIDAAQSVPHIPVDVQQLNCDFLAFSSHKLMGPMGVGVLWVRRSIIDDMQPYQSGSNMAHAVTRDNWEYSEAAHRFGAGTPNVSGPVGLVAAVAFIRELGFQRIKEHEQELTSHLLDGLSQQKRVRILGGRQIQNRISLFCFAVDGLEPEDLARRLDQEGIAIRAGDMASFPLLQRFGLKRVARVSLYIYNDTTEIDRFTRALRRIIDAI
jgi:cysteine desulfurase / selenocysteine lyase